MCPEREESRKTPVPPPPFRPASLVAIARDGSGGQAGPMHVRMPALLLAARQHGETAVIARLLTEEFGLVAAYVAGGRGRRLRPVLIPGNAVDLQLAARSESQLPFAKLELVESRGALLGEPLPAAAIGWTCAFTATVLPEREPYPALYEALGALLSAIGHAPSARGWIGAMVSYETLVLRELGYGGGNAGRGRPAGLASTEAGEIGRGAAGARASAGDARVGGKPGGSGPMHATSNRGMGGKGLDRESEPGRRVRASEGRREDPGDAAAGATGAAAAIGGARPSGAHDLEAALAAFDRLAPALERYLLADRRGDVMAARHRLRALLGRML